MFSNWYKLAQLSDIEVIDKDDHDIHYTNIGHGWYDAESKTPNYLWYFFNGEIVEEEQCPDELSHSSVFKGSDYDINKSFSGRFESSTGRATVHRPVMGVAKYRPVPKSILFKLYQKFPEIRKIYVY